MFFFLDEVSRDSNDTIEEDPIGIDVKNEVIEDDFDVKGHIITEHKDIKRQIVKCTKPKRVLPNDENAIQNHINSGHNEEKQQSTTNSGTPKKIESEINTVHEGKKSHMCPKCEKSFSIAGNLKVHISTVHEGNKPFECPSCDKRFGLNMSLNLHIKLKHGKEKLHKCSLVFM